MGTQRPVVIGETLEDMGGPVAEHHGKNKLKVKSSKLKVEEKIKEEKFGRKENREEKEEIQETIETKDKEETKAEKPKKTKVGKAKVRSKKYQKAKTVIEPRKLYEMVEAIDLVKKTSLSEFDGSVDVHIRLMSKNKKGETARGTLKYPHSTGKKLNIVILDEAMIAEIDKTKKTNFDIALATPEMMPKVAKLAKILGPKGKMPNPKSGTVTAEPEKTKKDLEGGMVEYKTDSYGIIHQVIGKVSTEPNILLENLKTLVNVLPQDKISSVYLSATMGPSVKVLTSK